MAQSVWLELGLAYQGRQAGTFDTLAKFGVRGVYPLSDTAGLFAAAALRRGLILDAGGWFTFPVQPEDPFGLRAHVGAGLTLTEGRFGLALSGALTYEVERNLDLFLMYTHRPLILPRLSQAFELSAGVRFNFD